MFKLSAHGYPLGPAAEDPQSLATALTRLAEAGFSDIELMRGQIASWAEIPDPALPVVAMHTVPAQLSDGDGLRRDLAAAGCRNLVVSGPLEWEARHRDDWQRTAATLNHYGLELAKDDIRLLYHNHDFEFTDLAGSGPDCAWDLLVDEVDPAACGFCLDCGWPALAQRRAAPLIEELAAGIDAIHLRDFDGRQPCPLGKGRIRQAPILAAIDEHADPLYIAIEQDPDPERDAVADLIQGLEVVGRDWPL